MTPGNPYPEAQPTPHTATRVPALARPSLFGD